MIDCQILVDENVPEAGPSPQPLGQVPRKFARLLEDRERIAVCVRRPQPPIGNSMVGEVQARLDR
jgi:hypothetical protein